MVAVVATATVNAIYAACLRKKKILVITSSRVSHSLQLGGQRGKIFALDHLNII